MGVETTTGTLAVLPETRAGVDTEKTPISQSGKFIERGGRVGSFRGLLELMHRRKHLRRYRFLTRFRGTPIATLRKDLCEQRMPSLPGSIDKERRGDARMHFEKRSGRAQVAGNRFGM